MKKIIELKYEEVVREWYYIAAENVDEAKTMLCQALANQTIQMPETEPGCAQIYLEKTIYPGDRQWEIVKKMLDIGEIDDVDNHLPRYRAVWKSGLTQEIFGVTDWCDDEDKVRESIHRKLYGDWSSLGAEGDTITIEQEEV